MAVTFNPQVIAFGNVNVGNRTGQTIVVTNSDSSAQTITLSGSNFSIDPASIQVPPHANHKDGKVTFLLFFEPGSSGSASGTISAGADQCTFTGTGVESDLASSSMTNKALLLKVPDYANGVFEQCRVADLTQSIMSSYLRLGTFDLATESDRGKELLKLIHQAGPPGDPSRGDQRMAGGAGTTPAWDFNPATEGFGRVPPLQPRTAANAAADAGNRDVFFLDDVRKRDVDVVPATDLLTTEIKGNGLTMAQRQEESARLFSRGGWRDHSDGNRITTTYGDKVEVIRGNYKMIVMGRQDDPGEAMGWEASGSHVMDYAPGTMPGAGFWLEWVPDYQFTFEGRNGEPADPKRKGVWLLVNTTENVYEYARKAGNFREETWGDVIEEYVGSENPPTGSTATDDVQGSHGHEPPVRLTDRNYDLPWKSKGATNPTTGSRTTPNWPDDNYGNVRSNPHIIEKVWAKRIDSWTGSSKTWVDDIDEKTFAKNITSSTTATKIEETTIADDIYGYTGSATSRTKTHEETYAKTTFELVDVLERVESNTRAGSIFEATTAGTIWESNTCALHMSLEVGPKVEINVAAALEMFFGVKMEFDLAKVWEFAVFDHTDIKAEKKKVSIRTVNTAMRDYILAVQCTTNTMQDERVALKAAVKALSLNLGV